MDQPGKVTKPARGQLNTEKEGPLLLQKHPWLSTYHSYVLLFALLIELHVHSWAFAVVPVDMAVHQVSTKHSILHVFILYGYMYAAPQDESYCYDLYRDLILFSLRAIWYMCTLLYV